MYGTPTPRSATSSTRVGRRLLWSAGVLCFLLLGGAVLAPGARAEGNEDCLECHDDVVDADKYATSVHRELECVFCHQDVELNDDMEHETEGLSPVDCAECHEEVAAAHEASVHGQALAAGDTMAPQCWDCHGSHFVRKSTDPTSPTSIFSIPATCGACHREGSKVSRTHAIGQESILRNYSQSIHGAGLFEKGLTVTAVCTSCHTAHDIFPHTDERSSVHPDRVQTTCTACHGRIEDVHARVIEGRLWQDAPGKIPVCVDCHMPHEQRLKEGTVTGPESRYKASVQNDTCFGCHGSEEYRDRTMTTEGGEAVSLYMDANAWYTGSVHGLKGVACARCHTGVVRMPEERHCETITTRVDCAVCHAEQVSEYQTSAHGTKAAEGDPDAPSCLDCHDKHAITSHRLPISPTFPRNVPQLCGRCHQEGGKAAQRLHSDMPVVESYLMSIHGKGLEDSGLLVTATCVNCHSAHGPLPLDDPASTVHDDNVAATCGQCHYGIEQEFKTSIHGPGNSGTQEPLPTCKHCHSSHTISRADASNFRLQMTEQCGSCHEDETETFFDTVHGQSSLLNSQRSAKCYDCHGSHGILPPSDPASTLSPGKVVDTCAQCHQGAHRQFAGYLTHATHHDPETYPWLFWTFWGMTLLLLGTLVVALLHTGAWLVRLWLTRDEWRAHKALAVPAAGTKLYRRFDRYQRMQHLFLILSFFVLAITGMALKFSYTGWAQGLGKVVGFDALSTLHRLGAVVLFGVFVVHLEYVRRKKKRLGRTWKQMLTGPDTIMFGKQDLSQAKQAFLWFIGKGERPRFGRYTYWEKFDYLAVFWGVAVIGVTGLMRWFPELFTHVVPGWFINVAAIIHSDEALLAVGFIFTIHFFNTHFRPDKFPMDPVIFTGRVTVDELKYDKPAEYARLVESGDLEEHLVEPFPEGVEKASRIFGFTMLTIGLILIALIVVGMLVAYR